MLVSRTCAEADGANTMRNKHARTNPARRYGRFIGGRVGKRRRGLSLFRRRGCGRCAGGGGRSTGGGGRSAGSGGRSAGSGGWSACNGAQLENGNVGRHGEQ